MVRAVSYLSRLAIAFASLCILSPSGFAGESNPPPLTEYASPVEPRKVEKEPRNKPERPLISRLVAQPVGACVGTMVAVPVKVVRTVRSETKRMLDTLLDDFGGERSLNNYLLAVPMAIPFGIASGTVLGSVHGVKAGLKYGVEKPFSPESMGVTEPSDQP